jgi:hypothetical protein
MRAPSAAPQELDGKKKKTKGTLGIGNGAIFFASESSKVGPSRRPAIVPPLLLEYAGNG